jgi:hypothetical protein
MKTLYLLLLTTILVAGCQNSKQDNSQPTATTPETEEVLPKEEVQSLTESEIRAFMQRWLKVYNTHTFDTYTKMYDPELFVGIKRPLGGAKNTYNYDGWVENKRTEFRKYKPEVLMNNLRVTNLNENGRSKVSFEQIWISYATNYADKGEKVMTLRKVNGDIKIVYEELLYSERADEYLSGYDY